MDHAIKSPGFQIKESSTTEEISHLKLQLEGSNNLVKEMEAVIYNLKKEHNYISKTNAGLKIENQRLKGELSLQESAKSQLQGELQDLLEILSSLKGNITLLYDEKENFSGILDSERNRSQQLESDLQVHELELLKLREEIRKNKDFMAALKNEWNLLNYHYSKFLKYWEKTDMLQLETKNSQTEKPSVKDLEENTKLDHLKSEYMLLEKEVQKFNLLLHDISQQNQNSGNSFQINLEELYNSNNYQKNFMKSKKGKEDFVEKEGEIVVLPKAIKEENSFSESLEATSEKCDIEISRHLSLCANLEEVNYEKSILLNSNYVLNQIENYKKALREIKENFHKKLLKQSLKLNKQINSLKLEVERKDDIICKLYCSSDDFRAAKENFEREFAKLKDKNLKLQNDIISLKKKKKESELLVYEKNLCITQKDTTITQLKEQISKIDDEKTKLNSDIMKFKTCLRNLSGNLIPNLNIAEYDRKVSEKEIENMLVFKDGSMKELQNTVNTEIKNETFMAEKLLESIYKDVTCDKINIQKDIKELQGKIAPEKLDKSVQIQDINCENLKTEIKHLKKELQLKEKSNLERSLLIQQLQKCVDEYKKELLEFTQSEKKKIDELSIENHSLQNEIQILKTETKSDCLCKVNSGLTVTDESKNNKDIIGKCIELFIEFIKNSECNDYCEKKKKLISLVAEWKEDITNFPEQLYIELTEFFGDQLNMGKILESKLSNLSKAYFNFSSKICQFCESINIDPFDAFLKPYGSHIDYRSSYETVSNIALNEIIEQMHLCLNVLQLYVTSMRKDIVNKSLEIESLKGNIESIKTKINQEESLAKTTELASV